MSEDYLFPDAPPRIKDGATNPVYVEWLERCLKLAREGWRKETRAACKLQDELTRERAKAIP